MVAFCEKCHEKVKFGIKNVKMEKEIKGKKVEIEGKEAFCLKCKSFLFVAEIRDYNLKQLEDKIGMN